MASPTSSSPAAPAGIRRPPFLTVGTVVWLSSELMFFVALFAAAFTLRAESPGPWPPEGAELNVPLALVLTAILLSSSVTMHFAARSAERFELATMRRWLGATIALGAIFVAGQAYEWGALEFSIDTHPFGSVFYTVTGFHGLHLIAGLVALAVILGRASRPTFLLGGRPAVEMATAYWHFVDAVWIAVLTVVYLV